MSKTIITIIIIMVIAGAGYWIYQSTITLEEVIPSIEPEPIGPDTEVFTEPPEPEADFCGQSTGGRCLTDSDCVQGGCSGEVCQSKDEESIITPCVFRECFDAEAYNRQCKCVNEQCQWYKYPRE